MSSQRSTQEFPNLPSTRSVKTAKWISRLSNPSILALIECIGLGFILGTLSGWLWIVFVLAITTLAPVIYIARLSNRGRITDFDVFIRQQRNKPYIFIGVCAALTITVILIFKAPWTLVFLCIIALIQTLIMFVINRFWKISAHTASSASFSVVAWQLLGPIGLLAFIIVPIIGWSRVKLHRHSISQVIVGAVTGGAIYYLAFTLFYIKP